MHAAKPTARLAAYMKTLQESYPQFIGFPVALDFDYHEIEPFYRYFLNNIGDPYVNPRIACHSKEFEREVIDFFADLLRAPQNDRWGYVTTGGSEGNMYGMYLGRELYPEAIVYYSDAAHYSVAKNAHLLGMQGVAIPTNEQGEMDYAQLTQALSQRPGKAAVVVATIGSTMTEARDDITAIQDALRRAGTERHHIHCDAALDGALAPFIDPRPAFDFADGADSVSISGYKFIGAAMPHGVVITRRQLRDMVASSPFYIGSPDTTISGSRSGHTVLMLWWAIQQLGIEGLRKRTQDSLKLAAYTHERLLANGVAAWRNPHALTVVFPEPPSEVAAKWQLACYDGLSHIICMPGITTRTIDAFVADMTPAGRPVVPATPGVSA